MKSHLKTTMFASALATTLIFVVPPAEAGGFFGIHIATGGFGVSVGSGDWGPYTDSWSNPQWSLDFNVALSGYGEWVWVAGLGRVWRPWVAVDWRPYTHGRWVRTTLGWTWVAYEPWGYVPHHYGSWAMCDFGWVWVPGYSYSSANVVWVRSGGYVGWYARPPWGWSHAARGYRHGYRDGYRDGWYDARYATYVDWHHLGSDNVSHYAVRHTVAARGQVQDHAAPPTADEARQRGGVPVPEAPLSQRTITMNGRQIAIARPEGVAPSIERHASGTAAAALSPAALEQRQPLVHTRPSAATSRKPLADRGAADDNGSRRSSPDAARGPAVATADHGDEGTRSRPGRSPSTVSPRRPAAISSAGSRPEVRSHGAASSGAADSSSTAADSRFNRESQPRVRGTEAETSSRPGVQRSSRYDSYADRSRVGAGSSPNDLGGRIPGADRASSPTTLRAPSPGGQTAASSTGARRQAAPREASEAEADEKPARRSQKVKRR